MLPFFVEVGLFQSDGAFGGAREALLSGKQRLASPKSTERLVVSLPS